MNNQEKKGEGTPARVGDPSLADQVQPQAPASPPSKPFDTPPPGDQQDPAVRAELEKKAEAILPDDLAAEMRPAVVEDNLVAVYPDCEDEAEARGLDPVVFKPAPEPLPIALVLGIFLVLVVVIGVTAFSFFYYKEKAAEAKAAEVDQ